MNIILKIDSARKLKKYISTHPRIASNTGCEAILDQLYQAYADSQEHDLQPYFSSMLYLRAEGLLRRPPKRSPSYAGTFHPGGRK